MSILSICNEPNIMNIIRIIVLLINIIKITTPIVLIVFVMIKIMGAVTKHDQEEIMKTIRSVVPNVIAAVLIFLIPTFVDIVARITFPNSDYSKCISGISKEKVEAAYISKIEELITRALETENYSDYVNAKLYLSYIKDKEKRSEYESLLADLALQFENIDNPSKTCNGNNNYANVNYNNFKWTKYNKNDGPIKKYVSDDVSSYAIWAPENINDLNGVSLPLIVWFHGSEEFVGKSNENRYVDVSLPKVVSEWGSTGFEPIPAIIVAPHGANGWWSGHKTNDVTVEGLIKYAADYYKIDTSKIVFWGHSSGGFGAIEMTWDLKEKVNVYKIITMSSQQTSYKSSEGGKEFYSKIPIRGYGEIEKQKELFNWIGQPDNFTYYKGEIHGEVPRRVLLEDNNNDKISDVIFWLFGKNEKCDSNSGNNTTIQDNGILKIYYLGLGRYDGFIIIGNGTTLFIDGGYESQGKKAIEYIKKLGITKIDGLIGSHMHHNHIDAHMEFIKQFNVGGVYYGEDPGECLKKKTCTERSSDPTKLVKMIKENNIPMTILTLGNDVMIGNLKFDIIAPDGFVTTGGYPENTNSVNMILKFGNHKFYFSGDHVRSGEILKKYDKSTLDVDIFKWPHHGQESVANNFLDAVSPEYIIIPNSSIPDVAQKGINHTKATGYATGSDGYVLAESDGVTLKVTKEKTR